MSYVFINKRSLTPRTPKLAVGRSEAKAAIAGITSLSPPSEVVHFDLETVGLVAVDPMRVITNVGIACDDWCAGIDLTHLTPDEAQPLWDWLKQCKLGGFNLHFDIKWPWGSDISPPMIGCDTAIWFRWLATEQLKSHPHSLEQAIAEILGWPDELFQKSWLKDKLAEHGLKKDDMYKLSLLEPKGYTHYCALDAEASYQLERVLREDTDRHGFTQLWNDFSARVLPHKIYRNVQAEYFGIEIDRDQCFKWIVELQRESLLKEADILDHEMVKPHIEKWRSQKLVDTYTLRVSEKKHFAKKQDEPWLDITAWRFIKAEESQLEKLPTWTRQFGGRFYKVEPVLSISGKTKPLPRFNFHSTDDMKWLIYDCWLGEENYEIIYYKDNKPGHLDVRVDGTTYEIELTASGGLPTGGDILKLFGDVGQKINDIKRIHKVLGDFLWKYYNASARDGRIHPGLKINGAATGRAAGG